MSSDEPTNIETSTATTPEPAVTTPEPEIAPVQQTETETPQRKLQLNPIGGGSLMAIGTESSEEKALAEAAAIEQLEKGPAQAQFAHQGGSTVEIPRDVELAGDLEAEIAAAMQGEAQSAAVAEVDPSKQDLPDKGARLQGVVQSIHADDVFLDLGFRIPGVLQLRQFEGAEPPEIGSRIPVVVSKVNETEGLISVNLPRGKQSPGGNWDAVETGQIVDCVVTKTNKGGLEVTVGSLRGFMPAGQVDLRFVESLDGYVGQRMQVKIIEANPQKKNLVVSRRALLIEERKEKEAGFWETAEEGAICTGTVKTIKDYGAFVDLGGADGFLHIGEISWTRIGHPNEVLTEGQEVTVKILKLEKDKKKISLGMKQTSQNPWSGAAEKYIPQSVVKGRVRKITEFGAFIELEPGIDGLIHISELDWKRVRKVTDVLQDGQEVEAKVLEFDPTRKRVSLSLKQMREDPRKAEMEARAKAEAEADAAEAAAASRRPPRPANLRGGIAGSNGGGLFGNPSDFR